MDNHPYPRTERDLRWLAVNFSQQNITRGLAERLECLAAWHRFAAEAAKAPVDAAQYANAQRAYGEALVRLNDAGVGQSEGEFTFSPCCGPDAEVPA